MALQKQKIPLTLTAGMDTKTDEFNSVSFKLVENFKAYKPKAFQKRYGHNELSTSVLGVASAESDISSANYLLSSNDSLLLSSVTGTYNYMSNLDKWNNLNNSSYTTDINSELLPSSYSEKSIFSNRGSMASAKHAENSNYAVSATVTNEYLDPTNYLRYLIIKVENKSEKSTIILDEINLTAPGTYSISIEMFDTYCLVFYRNSTVIRAQKYDFNSTTITSSDNLLISGISSSLYFDTCNDGTYSYLAAVDGASTNVYLYKIDSSLTVTNTSYTDASSSNYNYIFVGTYASGVRIMYGNSGANTNIRHVGYDSSLSQTYSETALNSTGATNFVRNCGFVSDGTNSYFIYTVCGGETVFTGTFPTSYGTGTNRLYILVLSDASNSTVTSQTEIMQESIIQSAPVILNNNILFGATKVWGQYYVKNFQTYFITSINIDSLKPTIAGKSLYLTYRPFLQLDGENLQKFYVDGDKLTVCLPKLEKALTEALYSSNTLSSKQYYDIIQASFDYNYNSLTSTNINNGLYISGSVLKYYDGKSLVEDSFLDDIYIYGFRTLSGSLPSAVYGVYVVARWTDNYGNVHRGVPVYYAVNTSGGFQVSVGGVNFTQKTDIQIEYYITQGNGTIPYLQATRENGKGLTVFIDDPANLVTDTEILYTVSSSFSKTLISRRNNWDLSGCLITSSI